MKLENFNHRAILLLGGNLGNVKGNLKQVSVFLSEIGELKMCSSIYKTEAWGMANTPDFLNQVVILETNLKPHELLRDILGIEEKMGRVRVEENRIDGYMSRTMDVDILFFDDLVMDDSELQIPHPKIPERNFVLKPLMEIVPDFVHPKIGQPVRKLYEQAVDSLKVELLNE